MTQKQIDLVKSTWNMVAAMDPVTVGNLFYGRVFAIAPEAKLMFGVTIDEQSRKFMAMMHYIIIKLDKLDTILPEVTKLGRLHGGYGVKAVHYKIGGEALLWTLEKGLADKWNEETKEAWVACYTILSNAMITAADKETQKAA